MARRSEERIIDVLRFVDSYIKINSFPPSIREICAGTTTLQPPPWTGSWWNLRKEE